MTTLLDLTTIIQSNVARVGDEDAKAWAVRGVNAGMYTAALMFEPPELRTVANGTAVAAGTAIDLTSLQRLLRVDEVYNDTGSQKVWPLNFQQLESLWLPTSGSVSFFALHGWSLYYRPLPFGNEILNIYYFGYPDRLDQDADVFPLHTQHEEFVMSFGTAYTWACLEELEDVDMWMKITDKLTIPEATITQIRRMLREEVPSGNNV